MEDLEFYRLFMPWNGTGWQPWLLALSAVGFVAGGWLWWKARDRLRENLHWALVALAWTGLITGWVLMAGGTLLVSARQPVPDSLWGQAVVLGLSGAALASGIAAVGRTLNARALAIIVGIAFPAAWLGWCSLAADALAR